MKKVFYFALAAFLFAPNLFAQSDEDLFGSSDDDFFEDDGIVSIEDMEDSSAAKENSLLSQGVLFEDGSIKIAGKTGTAEVAQYKNSWHSWFVCYAPSDAPVEDTVVVCVLVEAANQWEWWAPYASNIILQGIFANQTYDEAIDSLGFRYLSRPVGRQE